MFCTTDKVYQPPAANAQTGINPIELPGDARKPRPRSIGEQGYAQGTTHHWGEKLSW